MTTLTATYSAGAAGVAPPRVLLQVAAAPSLTPSYASSFAASVDGWTGGGTLAYNQGPFVALTLTSVAGATTVFSRTVTGLTIGQTYALTAMVDCDAGSVAMGVTGFGGSSFQYAGSRTAMTRGFTATATSHVITFTVKAPKTPLGGTATGGVVSVDTVTVIRTSGWQGTTIRRTDDNGTSVVVRESLAGQDTTGTTGSATMTVTDYEACLSGPVAYTVTDGSGGTATANLTAPATPGAWVTLPATAEPATAVAPAFVPVDAVLEFGESSPSAGSVHVVIGREDPIVNPGPLGLRTGRLVVFCADYPTAAALRAMLAGGAVAMLRQPAIPGLDLYFYAQDVAADSTEPTTPRRWLVTITYQEVTTP